MAAERSFVLDTSALLALRGDEPGADRVHALLAQASKKRCRILISFMTRMELLYCIRREEGENAAREALRLVDSFAIRWVSWRSRHIGVRRSNHRQNWSCGIGRYLPSARFGLRDRTGPPSRPANPALFGASRFAGNTWTEAAVLHCFCGDARHRPRRASFRELAA